MVTVTVVSAATNGRLAPAARRPRSAEMVVEEEGDPNIMVSAETEILGERK